MKRTQDEVRTARRLAEAREVTERSGTLLAEIDELVEERHGQR